MKAVGEVILPSKPRFNLLGYPQYVIQRKKIESPIFLLKKTIVDTSKSEQESLEG